MSNKASSHGPATIEHEPCYPGIDAEEVGPMAWLMATGTHILTEEAVRPWLETQPATL